MASCFSILRVRTMNAILPHTFVFGYMLTTEFAILFQDNAHAQQQHCHTYCPYCNQQFFHLLVSKIHIWAAKVQKKTHIRKPYGLF